MTDIIMVMSLHIFSLSSDQYVPKTLVRHCSIYWINQDHVASSSVSTIALNKFLSHLGDGISRTVRRRLKSALRLQVQRCRTRLVPLRSGEDSSCRFEGDRHSTPFMVIRCLALTHDIEKHQGARFEQKSH